MHITITEYLISLLASGLVGRTVGKLTARRAYRKMLQRQARYTVWPDDHQDIEWSLKDASTNDN